MNKTPISILQEVMVQRKQNLPIYYTEDCINVPGSNFKCTVNIGNNLRTCGYGFTKKEAKQDSALKALEILGFSTKIHQQTSPHAYNQPFSPQKSEPFINYVGQLNEYASVNGHSYPTYIDEIMPINGKFITQCNFLKWRTEGYGSTKKDAKQDAAKNMLKQLKTENVTIVTGLQNLKLEKCERIDRLAQEILNKYEKLPNVTNKISPSPSGIKPIPNVKTNATNLEELKCEMEKCGYKFTLEIFQRNPYIMKMVIDGDAVIMGAGTTKDEAMHDLFENALLMFSYGFTMSTAF